ncbi:hypothetical protein GF351_04655 [Candidatus Woesearchaeota archaeon]|nr:hypothetical protein [Candidatus Woesearchaeota archaeon]
MDYKKKVKQQLEDLKSDPEKKLVKVRMPHERYKNIRPLRTFRNKLIIQVSRKLVPSHLKNWLLRRAGLKIGHDVCLPNDILFDPCFPELITIEEGALIGAPNRLYAHEFRESELVLGSINVGRRVLVGAFSYLGPGAAIAEKSILNFGSELVDKSVPSGQLWGGKPVSRWKEFGKEELEKYFREPDGNYKEYYREARKKIKAFQKDESIRFLKIPYNGKRLNAGDDWWRARNVLRIWINGAVVEFCRFLGPSWLKNMLYRMVGMKIGKNVKIGKGCVPDHIYPDTITLQDDVELGERCEIAGHEYTITQTVFGRVLIKKGAKLKEHVLVRTGTTVEEGAVVEPNSGISKEIPAHERWGGMPARFIEKIGEKKETEEAQ